MYKIVLLPVYLLSLLPLKVLYLFSDGMAFLLRKVFHYRSSVVYSNIARSFPDLKYPQIEKIAKDFYAYFCDLLFESIWGISASSSRIAERIQIENPGVLTDIYNRYGKAVILTGHIGNWELLASSLCQPIEGKDSYRDARFIFLYKSLRNKFLNSIVVDFRKSQYRKRGNNGTIVDSHSITNYMMEHEDGNNFYFFIADQSGKKESRYVVNFLNQPSLMLGGAESLARALNLPVIYMDMDRYERGKYRVSFTVISENSQKTRRGDITLLYTTLLEKSILKNKACWLWSHKRWKIDINTLSHKLYRLNDNKKKETIA